jgi:CrcB protein
MNWTLLAILTALGGGIGAMLRFGIGRVTSARVAARFPIHTLLINLSGAFALGLLTGLAARVPADAGLAQVLGTGVVGGYTTFSAVGVESVGMLRAGRVGVLAAYLAATLALGCGAASAGIVLAAG